MALQLKTHSKHPSTHKMIIEAISFLNQRKGSSVPAIKKFMTMKYEVDCVHLAPFIKKIIKSAVKKGELKQFKMSYSLSKKLVRTSTAKNNSEIVTLRKQ